MEDPLLPQKARLDQHGCCLCGGRLPSHGYAGLLRAVCRAVQHHLQVRKADQVMELRNFIGKVVVGAESKRRYVIQRVTAAYMDVRVAEPDARGRYAAYRWNTDNGDPISKGTLVFEDASLNEPFKVAFRAHCQTEKAYWEGYGYWLRKS